MTLFLRHRGGVVGSPRYISPVADALGEAPGVNAGAEHGPRFTLFAGVVPASWSFAAVGGLALAVGLLGWRYWPSSLFWAEAAGAPVMVGAIVVDLREHRIPNLLVAGGAAAIVVALSIGAALSGRWSPLGGAAVGAAVFAVPLLVSNLVSARHLPGVGDVKLAAVLGLLLGAVHPLLAGYGLVVALLLGVAFGVLRRLRGSERGTFAFAPALCVGSLAALVVGPWWLSQLGVAPM